MTKIKSRVPALRFPEFKGEWEEKRLGKVLIKQVDPVDVDIDTYYSEIGIRSHGKGIFYKEPILGKDLGNKRVFWIKEEAFIVNIVFAWEQAVAKTTEKEKGMIASHRFPMYIPKKDAADVDYILHFFLTRKGKRLLELASPGGAGRNKTLGQKEFEKLNLILPLVSEQIKIASFLTTIDDQIQLLKLKKDKVEAYKRGVVQQIFSRKLRFKDERGKEYADWEGKELGEIGYFQTSSVDKLSKDDEENVFLVNYMNVYRHETINNQTKEELQIVTAKESQILGNNLKRGDILFTPSSETPSDIGHSVVIFEDLDRCVYSYHLLRFRPQIKLNILYSHYFCNIPNVLSQLTRLATGSTRFTISVKAFSSIEVKLPSLPEQEKIANFLSAIDAKITFCDDQITKSQKYKDALLQQMFV